MIRNAACDDAPVICEMLRAMVAEMETYGSHAISSDEAFWSNLPDSVAARISNESDYRYMVAEDSGEPRLLGFTEAHTFLNAGAWSPKRILHMGSLFVRPASRRAGVGRVLLEAILAWGVEENCEFCQLNVLPGNPASSLYESAGFETSHVQMIKRNL